jgi:hypothetical protein
VHDLFVDIAIFLKGSNDRLRPVMGCRVVSHPETVKRNSHSPERIIEMPVVAFRERSGRDPRIFSGDDNRRPMVIRTADEDDLFACPPHIADIRIGRDVCPQVPEMAGAVGVRQPAGNQQRRFFHEYFFRC